MSQFATSLRARIVQARQAVRAADEAGDQDRASDHGADLGNLERLAAEHGIAVGDENPMTNTGR